MATPSSLEALSDRALLDRFALALRQDRERTRVLLELIDVIDRRKLWAKQGHSSLFSFCVDRFHMSEPTAAKRIRAARAARRFPVIFDMVARGELHLSGIHRLAAYLTPDNHRQVLARAKHQTLKQIDVLVRELSPEPDVPSSVRKLPDRPVAPVPSLVGAVGTPSARPAVVPKPAEVPAGNTLQTLEPALREPAAREPAPREPAPREPEPREPAAREPVPRELERVRRSPDPAPLSPGRYKLQVTLSEKAHQTLRQLQDLLAHQVPNGDPAVIVERALEVLLEQTLKKKAALTERPRAPKQRAPAASGVTRRRNVPAAIKREVWQRERGRCSFVGADGKSCGETRGLEFAHAQPWGKGGEHSAENLSLRCRAHNAFEADRDYGEAFMRSKREGGVQVREPRAVYATARAVPVAARPVVRGYRNLSSRSARDRARLQVGRTGTYGVHGAGSCRPQSPRKAGTGRV